MAPNIDFELSLCQREGDEETLLRQEKSKTSPLLITKEVGRQAWQQILRQKQGRNYEPIDEDGGICKSLFSIRILEDATQNQNFLRAFQGSLYKLPHKLLQQASSLAPKEFHARVADFNDNLFYEMQPLKGLEHLGMGYLQDLLGATECLGSFLATESTFPQPAHVDYEWHILESENGGDGLQIAFFPLTKEGMFLQVWPRKDEPSISQIDGQVIYIPYGRLLVLPAKTIHGGGFRTTQEGLTGNLRFHLYLSRENTQLPIHQTNKYTEPKDRRKELSRRYINAPCMSELQQFLFV